MATIKTTNRDGKYSDEYAFFDTINYIMAPHKTPHCCIGGHMIDPLDIPGSMKQVAIHYGKTNGVQLNHYILSFSPQETNDYKKVYTMAQQIASGIGRHFQTAFAVHEDRPYLHIHFIVNRISYIDGHRWRGTRQEFSSLCNDIRSVLQSYHIPTLQYIPVKASHKY